MFELLTPAEMTEIDRLTIKGGIPGVELMERAGRAVAEVAAKSARGGPIVVVAGPGNNGGDGYVAARLLAERGCHVRVLAVGAGPKAGTDAAQAAARWPGPTEIASPQGLAGAEVIIDAIFGAGLDRSVEGHARVMIEAMNECGATIVAVDLPSGINGLTGAVQGAAVRAAATVTFFRRKPGHLLFPGRTYCGRVEVADIGIAASALAAISPKFVANSPMFWGSSFPRPRVSVHKYGRGHVVVGSGGVASTGAARLAARGALRAGAGLVTIASPREALAVHAAANEAVMVRPVDGAEEFAAFLADPRRNSVVLGPGGGVSAEMRAQVHAALESDCHLALDADALMSFVPDPSPLFAAFGKRPGKTETIITPHEGEFSRLFDRLYRFSQVFAKLEKATLAADISKAIILFKGPDTVVATPDGRASIGENAPPWLATAGSGDVLTGIIAGLLAQGMPGFEAASAAVWVHGEAANEFGPGLISEDLPDGLPAVYRRLFASLGAGGTGIA